MEVTHTRYIFLNTHEEHTSQCSLSLTSTAAIASDRISWTNLALGYELTGGLIRNAVLSALSLIIKHGGGGGGGGGKADQLVVEEEHLAKGAQLQLRYVCVCVCGGGGLLSVGG